MAKISKPQKEIIGLIDDRPIKPDFSKSDEEFVADLLRQVNEPFEKAQEKFEAQQAKKAKK